MRSAASRRGLLLTVVVAVQVSTVSAPAGRFAEGGVPRWQRAMAEEGAPEAAVPRPLSPRELIDRWVAMWNSYDLNQVDSLFVRDQTVSYFSSEYRGLVRGPAALRSHHERFGFVPGGKPPGNRLWLEDVVITPTGDRSSLVTATWKFQRTGSEAIQSGPVSFVLVDQGAGYRILHAHFANHPVR